MENIVSAWRVWAKEGTIPLGKGPKNRRHLIVQIINILRLSRKWESYEKAVENFRFMDVAPSEAQESVAEAIKIAARCNWDIAAIRSAIP
jgi:hypothetical protein